MEYVIKYIATALKEARENKGLSQRALSARTGVPQSHISKIESGAVDLRLSSLIDLARVLDLELTLVPRKTVPAVQSIVRTNALGALQGIDAERRALRELDRFQNAVAEFPLINKPKELARLQRQLRELQHFKLGASELRSIKEAHKTYREFLRDPHNLSTMREAVSGLQNLRNALAHNASIVHEEQPVRPAYSLDEEDESA